MPFTGLAELENRMDPDKGRVWNNTFRSAIGLRMEVNQTMVVDLAESRAKIDEIDQQILRLFEERMVVAADVAAYKRSTGKKVLDPDREREKIQRLREMAQDKYNQAAIEDLFRQIMSASRKYQYRLLGTQNTDLPFRPVKKLDVNEDTRVVCFGEPGAFSEQAMEEVFGKNIRSFHKSSFRDVLQAVADGEAKYGVVPIENTSTGGITDTYDLLLDYDITIVAEHVVKVEQALLAKPGAKLEDIKLVYSHPQGLLQCAPFLEEHGMSTKSYSSTSAAAKKIASEDSMTQAAIASTRAAEQFSLEVLQESINFSDQNFTRFIVISNQRVYLENADKISLCFEIKHQAGSLYNLLGNFYFNDLNLTKIESRPIEDRNWEYRFFVDIEGNLNTPEVGNALAGVHEFASQVRILGNVARK